MEWAIAGHIGIIERVELLPQGQQGLIGPVKVALGLQERSGGLAQLHQSGELSAHPRDGDQFPVKHLNETTIQQMVGALLAPVGSLRQEVGVQPGVIVGGREPPPCAVISSIRAHTACSNAASKGCGARKVKVGSPNWLRVRAGVPTRC